MSKVKILDCTLRDGGYINNWNFGKRVIKGVARKLEEARIDIIECGFLRDITYSPDTSVYSSVKQISDLLPQKSPHTMYVAMIALGDIPINKITPYDGCSIDGIRLTFHKHEWKQAQQAITELMQKGYKVFVQPVGTTSYSDEELLSLVRDVNELSPFAFYLVDTLGILYQKELRRLFYLIDHNLKKEIALGFHSHNNLQLSFANAQEFIRVNTKRTVIVDASIYGMGRGVGNLATELLAAYINDNIDFRYGIIPLLSVADKYIMPIYAKQHWGYALPYFLSASVKCHPNYASFLLEKSTLTVEDIHHVLKAIPIEERDLFNPTLAESLYYSYQKCYIDDSEALAVIKQKVSDKEVLLLAPGASVHEMNAEIQSYITKNHPVVISVNHFPLNLPTDMVFISSSKRFDLTIEQITAPCEMIVTSNVPLENFAPTNKVVNYPDYIGEGREADNAGAMAIRLLKKCHVKTITLAGFDGFTATPYGNFSIDSYRSPISAEEAEQKNKDISCQLSRALQKTSYQFLTPTRYVIE